MIRSGLQLIGERLDGFIDDLNRLSMSEDEYVKDRIQRVENL